MRRFEGQARGGGEGQSGKSVFPVSDVFLVVLLRSFTACG